MKTKCDLPNLHNQGKICESCRPRHGRLPILTMRSKRLYSFKRNPGQELWSAQHAVGPKQLRASHHALHSGQS
eukprot:1480489-Amphidinium_carterae.1